MRKIEPELITGMGYIGDNPGVLYRMGGAGEQTVVTGNPALLDGVKGSRFTSLTLHGKSTQVRTTGAQLCDFRNIKTSGSGDIIITFNKDGIGIVKGAPGNENYAFTILGKPVDLSLLEIGETYTSNESIRYTKKDNPGKYFYSRSIMFTEDIARIDVYVQRSIQDYKNGEILSPMLNKGNTVLAFEPYTGGAPSPSPSYPQEIESAGQSGEISVKVGRTEMDKNPQVVIIPTPGGLPGIPVSSGGNYTDKDGQQWVCDEIDLARGERVQRIEKLDLKSLLWSKQSRASNASGFWFSSRIKSASLFGANVKGTISNIGRLGNPYNMVGDYVWALTNGGSSEFRIGFADSTIDSLEKLTNLLNSLPEAYAMYCLAEPIRTPLPPETIAAYKSLKTYSPTTTVINDAGAGMSVGYKRRK